MIFPLCVLYNDEGNFLLLHLKRIQATILLMNIKNCAKKKKIFEIVFNISPDTKSSLDGKNTSIFFNLRKKTKEKTKQNQVAKKCERLKSLYSNIMATRLSRNKTRMNFFC